MEEIGNTIRISEKYPPMAPPLSRKLGYNGIIFWGEDIIKGEDIGL